MALRAFPIRPPVAAPVALPDQSRLLEAILETVEALVVVFDPDGRILHFNHACERLTGWTADEIVGRFVWDTLTPPEQVAELRATFQALKPDEALTRWEGQWLTRDGRRRLIAWQSKLLGTGQRWTHFLATGIDVTDSRRTDEAMATVAEVADHLATRGPTPETYEQVVRLLAQRFNWELVSIYLVEDDGLLHLAAQLGYDDPVHVFDGSRGVVGRVLRTHRTAFVTDVTADPDYLPVGNDVTSEISVPLMLQGEILGILNVEAVDPPLDERDLLMLEGVANRVASSVALGRRVRQLQTQAFHDALTGLANRALFMDRLEHALALLSRTESKVGVVFLDLDDFKTVNDGLGHAAGDELLRLVARRLETAVRAGDTVARLGGDEFAVLLEPVGAAGDALAAAERIMAALAEPFQLGSRQVTVRASIGVAIDDTTAGELLRDADVAMYRAKNDGRGRAVLFESSMREAAIARLDLERELRVAIERGDLFLDYQPVFDVATRVVTGVEALVRWRHATQGTLMPGSFIDLAEETGLIVPLGRQVLRVACADARSWQEGSAVPFLVSVNLSVRQLEHPGIVDDVAEALDGSGLEPGRLILEITESAFARNRERAVAAVSALRGLGVRIAIDDFGIGYSSLSFVKDLPLDILKVDRSFIADLPDVGARAGVVETFFRLGQVLGLQTVAEGVETEDQLSAVRGLGADLVQGYLLGRPMTPDAIGRILSAA